MEETNPYCKLQSWTSKDLCMLTVEEGALRVIQTSVKKRLTVLTYKGGMCQL